MPHAERNAPGSSSSPGHGEVDAGALPRAEPPSAAPHAGASGRAVLGPRGTHLHDRSHLQPPHCTLRKYSVEGGRTECWLGKLPRGAQDVFGHKGKKLFWGTHARRTENEAVTLIEDWLRENHLRTGKQQIHMLFFVRALCDSVPGFGA